jgi:hypothetical protein
MYQCSRMLKYNITPFRTHVECYIEHNNQTPYFDLITKKKTCNSITTVSEWKTVRFGVPQGSVLGLLLFNVYINDFPDTLKDIARTVLYVNDTTIFS